MVSGSLCLSLMLNLMFGSNWAMGSGFVGDDDNYQRERGPQARSHLEGLWGNWECRSEPSGPQKELGGPEMDLGGPFC